MIKPPCFLLSGFAMRAKEIAKQRISNKLKNNSQL